jgi:hypothetical protein
MKALIITVLITLSTFLGVSLTQNYFNDSTRGCTRYDVSASYWGYDCKDGTGFYEHK